MKQRIAAFLVFVSLLLPQAGFAQASGPVKDPNAHPYSRSDNEFASAIVIDAASGNVLYEYHADISWPAASLTKLMGALVFLDHRPSWDKIVDIRKQDEVGGGRLQVASGATLRVIDLLYSSVTASANNAAMALARITGLSKTAFIKQMNTKAKALGLADTTFVDPSGMDPKNVTTARDMAKLSNVAYGVDVIRRVATSSLYRFVIRNTGTTKQIKTTNDMLVSKEYDDYFVTGGKTGFLYESMYNLAVRVRPTEDANAKRQIVIVVLGSQTRDGSFKSAAALANWVWKAYTW
jgi:D-alanyl-D-alanine endopeptidase (penicillin-binding protein 7)